MKFSPDTWMIPVADIPSPTPSWPLPGVDPAFSRLGASRPVGCLDNCVLYTSGINLSARTGDLVLACEDCEVLSIVPWTTNTVAVVARNAATIAVYGGVKKSSAPDKGDFLEARQQVGVIGETDAGLRFELYQISDRTSNSRWYIDEEPPEDLLNPVNYLEAAAGIPQTRSTSPQRHEALREMGVYSGPIVAPWSETSAKALKAAQKVLGISTDGVWGPTTEDAVRAHLSGAPPSKPDKQPPAKPKPKPPAKPKPPTAKPKPPVEPPKPPKPPVEPKPPTAPPPPTAKWSFGQVAAAIGVGAFVLHIVSRRRSK